MSVLPYRVAQNQEYGDGTGKQSIAEQVLCRQSTVEFIGSLLKAVDTPDEPLPHLFETLPSTAQGLASLSDTTGSNVSRSCSPSLSIVLKNLVAEDERNAARSPSHGSPVTSPAFKTNNALKRFAPAMQIGPMVKVSAVPTPPHKRQRRINSAPADSGPSRWQSAPNEKSAANGRETKPHAAGKAVARQPMPLVDNVAVPKAAEKEEAPTVATAPKPKPKNPKRADRRRTIARFTTAILRAGGSNAFIARDGLGYRKAFDRFLVETYGDTFAEGGYWYENARVEPFFRVLFHIATDGRVQLDHDAVNTLFCKREKRQAAEWLLDEVELSKFGVTATQLAQIFEGPPSISATGYPRGTPLAIPTDAELDSGAVPGEGAAAAHQLHGHETGSGGAAAQSLAGHHHHGAHGYGFNTHGATPVAHAGGDHGSGGVNHHGVNHHVPGSNPGGGGGGGMEHYANPGGIPTAVPIEALHHHAPHPQEGPRMLPHHHPGHHHHHQGGYPAHISVGVPGSGDWGSAMSHFGYAHTGHVGHVGGHKGQHQHQPLHGSGTMLPPVSLPRGGNVAGLHFEGSGPSQHHGAVHAAHLGHHATAQHISHAQHQAVYGAALAHQHHHQQQQHGQPHGGQHPAHSTYDARVHNLSDPVMSGPNRVYSSDLSRIMSEFNNNPSSSDEFLKSFLQRTASELDNMAQMGGQGPVK